MTCRGGCMNHRSQAALHIRRAPTKQIPALDTWLKLIVALSRDNIVVAAEIKGSRPSSDRREYTLAFTSHIIEAESLQFVGKSASAFLVLIPRWIFRRNRDQPLCKIQHRRFGEPFPQSG